MAEVRQASQNRRLVKGRVTGVAVRQASTGEGARQDAEGGRRERGRGGAGWLRWAEGSGGGGMDRTGS